MKKRCVRRVWDTGVTAAQVITQNEKTLSPAQWNQQIIPVQAAVNGLLDGDWRGMSNWGPVIECINRIESLLKLARMPDNGFVDEIRVVCVESMERFGSSGAKSFRHGELKLIRELVSVYGDLLKEVKTKQFNLAIAHEHANRARILAGVIKRKVAPA